VPMQPYAPEKHVERLGAACEQAAYYPSKHVTATGHAKAGRAVTIGTAACLSSPESGRARDPDFRCGR